MKHISRTTGKYADCEANIRSCPNKGHMSDGAYALLQQNPKLNKRVNAFNANAIKKGVDAKNKLVVKGGKETFNTVGVKWENGNKFDFKTFVTRKVDLNKLA